MKPEKTVEELLHWRLDQAKMEAPPTPSAIRLLEQARPWWEKSPELFRSQVERLSQMPIGYDGSTVPALIVREAEESQALARVLEFYVRSGHLRFGFRMEPSSVLTESTTDLTFISDMVPRPLLLAPAIGSIEGEYRLDTELSPELARDWAHLKETDRMPFRLIVRYHAEL